MEEAKSSEVLIYDGKSDGVVAVDHKPVVVHGNLRRSNRSRRCSKANWTEEEDDILQNAVHRYEGKCWKKIAESLPGRTDSQCMHRWQKVVRPDLIKGPWNKEEDSLLIELVGKLSDKKWSEIALQLPGRLGKQCRERWYNHLKPEINKAAWTNEEERILVNAHAQYGNKWSILAKLLPGRTENSVKNHWHFSLKKRLANYSSLNVPRFITSSSPTMNRNDKDLSTYSIRTRGHSDVYRVESSLDRPYTGLCYEPIQEEDLNIFLSTGRFPSSDSYVRQPKRSKSVSPPRYNTKESYSPMLRSAADTRESYSILRSAAVSYDNVPSIIRKQSVRKLQKDGSNRDKFLNVTFLKLADDQVVQDIKSVQKCLEHEFSNV